MQISLARLFQTVPARRSRKAFTLMELLVVIAIFGILAAMLIPAVGRIRESGNEVTCASNLRQITQALLFYANDHNGMAPPGRNNKQHEAAGGAPGGTSLASTYFSSVWPYLYGSWDTFDAANNGVTMASAKRNVFQCPTRYTDYPQASMAPAEMFVSGVQSTFAWWDNYAYAINAMAAPDSSLSQGARALNPTRVIGMSSPSRTVALVEDYNWYATFDKYYNRYGVLPHRGKANFAFYDGHVERLGRSEIPTKAEAPGTVFWAGDYAQ